MVRVIVNAKRTKPTESPRRETLRRKKDGVLDQLSNFVNATDRKRGKLHEVFEPSFDWKECDGEKFIEQKLNYIHENPCRGNWELVKHPEDYVHSSARFYGSGHQGIYTVTSYMELRDIDLTQPWLGR